MPEITIYVFPPKGFEADAAKRKTVEWPVVPLKGQTINCGVRYSTGLEIVVSDVIHHIGANEIQVECAISKIQTRNHEAFRALTRDEGWH